MKYSERKFNKQEGEHEIEVDKLKYKFALKMATLICLSVVSSVLMLAVFFGSKTIEGFIVAGIIALVLGFISFRTTHSACL